MNIFRHALSHNDVMLAGMDMLCSDKTGTLTLNKLTVENSSVHPFGKYTPEQVLLYAALSAQRNSEEAIDLVSFHLHTLTARHAHCSVMLLVGRFQCWQAVA